MKRRLSHVQVIFIGYLAMVLLGTGLLLLPLSSATGGSVGFRNAFFTAASASCVTGLTLLPTGSSWSFFGQLVILLLIQVGGLGFMTIATLFFRILNKRMRLSARETMVESLNLSKVDGILRLSGKIAAGTAILEGTGALLLMIRFIPRYGFARGVWYSIFHAVSAFCNAGFDLFSGREAVPSLMLFCGDALVNLVIIALIVIGGLGFFVWDDLLKNRFRWRRYSLHTRLVLVITAGLLFGSALLFLLFGTGDAESPFGTRLLEALFSSATARTAGFNTTDTAALPDASKLLTVVLMLIGGSPGSTAGGIKTTTAAVLFLSAFAAFRGRKKVSVFGRSISGETITKSATVFLTNLSAAIVGTLVLCSVDGAALSDALFESFSAIGTVGMSTGITSGLSPFSSYLIALLMFMGRVGSVSFSVALLEKRKKPPVTYPEETVTVG